MSKGSFFDDRNLKFRLQSSRERGFISHQILVPNRTESIAGGLRFQNTPYTAMDLA
jgi:hypothetical protein